MSVYSRSFTSTLLQSSDLVSFLLPFLIFPSAPCLYCHFSLRCEPEVVQGQEEMTRVWQETAQGPDRAALFNFALLPVQHCSDTQTCTKTGSRFFSLWWPEAQIHILVNTYLNYLFGFLSFFKASLLQAGLVNHACIPHTDTHIIISWLGVGMTALQPLTHVWMWCFWEGYFGWVYGSSTAVLKE